MSDDLQTNLETYKIQLQQVEVALLAEPDNDGLLKLKVDLQEVIKITRELLSAGITVPAPAGGAAVKKSRTIDNVKYHVTDEDDEALEAAASSKEEEQEAEPPPAAPANQKSAKDWKVGDKCMAVWSKNGQYYEAVIDGISEGKAAITFKTYNVSEINKLTQLKTMDEISTTKKFVFDDSSTSPKPSKGGGKTQWQVEKEKRRQKALKKVQRLKQIEEEKEKEKNKWKEFNRKAVAKSFKGVKKASIFATTDKGMTKVGVGTCGTSGRPMTKFQHQDRHATGGLARMNYSTF